MTPSSPQRRVGLRSMNSRADSSLRILQIGAVALLCLHWTAMSIPERLWGVHHLAFLPVPVSLALTALLAFAVALSLHVEACKWVGDRLETWPNARYVTAVLLVAAMGSLFVQLPLGKPAAGRQRPRRRLGFVWRGTTSGFRRPADLRLAVYCHGRRTGGRRGRFLSQYRRSSAALTSLAPSSSPSAVGRMLQGSCSLSSL